MLSRSTLYQLAPLLLLLVVTACSRAPTKRGQAPVPSLPSATSPPSAAALGTASPAASTTGTATVEPSTPEALAYLNDVLDFIQQNSVKRDSVDWPTWRQSALALVQRDHPARTTADTYAAIRFALQQLGDHHSYFLDPEAARRNAQGLGNGIGLLLVPGASGRTVVQVAPGSPAADAGIQVGDTVVSDPASGIHLQVKRLGRDDLLTFDLQPREFSAVIMPSVRWLGGTGYILLPGFSGSDAQAHDYVAAAAAGIQKVAPAAACGWIVDLRTNIGGNGYPMHAAIGPLMPDGEAGAFVSPSGRTPWSFRGGRFVSPIGVRTFGVTDPSPLPIANPPVAVLTGPLTASSGEWVLVSFRGRPATRSFGSPTAGVPTANVSRPLSDGALLVLTTAVDADRTGQTYDSSLPPDEPVVPDWTAFGTDRDPVVLAAQRWLQSQSGCAASP